MNKNEFLALLTRKYGNAGISGLAREIDRTMENAWVVKISNAINGKGALSVADADKIARLLSINIRKLLPFMDSQIEEWEAIRSKKTVKVVDSFDELC